MVQNLPKNDDWSNLVRSGWNSGQELAVDFSITQVPNVTVSTPAEQAAVVSRSGTPSLLLVHLAASVTVFATLVEVSADTDALVLAQARVTCRHCLFDCKRTIPARVD